MSGAASSSQTSSGGHYTADAFHAWLLTLDEKQIVADFQRLKEEIAWYDWNVADGLACYAPWHSKTFGKELKRIDKKRVAISTYCDVLGFQATLRADAATLRLREVAVKGITDVERDLDLFKRNIMEFVVNDLHPALSALERRWGGDFGKLKHFAIDFDLKAYLNTVEKVAEEYVAGGDSIETARRVARYFPEIFSRGRNGNDKLAQIQRLSVSSVWWANTKARAGRAARWRPWDRATAATL